MASVIGQVAVPATHQSSQTLARGQTVLRHLEHASDLVILRMNLSVAFCWP